MLVFFVQYKIMWAGGPLSELKMSINNSEVFWEYFILCLDL
jgi:hypothetical protein